MLTCAMLSAGAVLDSCKRAIAGVNSDVILINYEDINRLSLTIDKNVVSNLELKAGTKGYKFECRDGSPVGEYNLVRGTYLPGWEHVLNLVTLVKSQEIKDTIETLSFAKVVAIVDNKERGAADEVRYEIYGLESGLELMESNNTTEYADEVVYNIKLSTGDAKENAMPRSAYKTDPTTTETWINGLVTA